jgi:cysteine desulfurase/selenocysteine lyase
LARHAYARLAELPGIRLIGPPGERGGLVSFALRDVHAHDVVTFADQDGIAMRGGHHCNQPLMKKLGLASTVRASFYLYNTTEEIDVLVASMRRILKFFGGT